MPNGHGHKEYNGHKYAHQDGTSSCQYGCGCWMGPTRSGGPTGLDPFGACPKNPADGTFLGGNADYDYVVTERFSDLESRLYAAESALKRVAPSKISLDEQLDNLKIELSQKNKIIEAIQRILSAEVFPV